MSLLTLSAQMKGDGYYRIQNFGTQRYAYLCDNTGFINYGTQSADVGAMQLWLGLERALDNPASVIYIKTVASDKFDLMAQGTGLYQVIKHYVQVTNVGDNKYQVSATQKGMTKYLSDDRTSLTEEQGVPGFQAQGKFRQWSVFQISSTDNYLGITPKYEVNGKFYQPYYVSFPFKKVSKDLKFYYVKEVDSEYGIAVMDEVTSEIIPGGMPLIAECSSASCANNKILPVTGGSTAPKNNMLRGVYFCNPERPSSPSAGVPFVAASMRTLVVREDGTLGLDSSPQNLTKLKMKIDGKTSTYMCLPANSSYLSVGEDAPAELKLMTRADYEAYIAEHSAVAVTGITLSETEAELEIGKSLQLTATVAPDNAADKEVVWSTSDASVATVSETGLVEAIAPGKVVITATSHDGTNITALCNITVKPVAVTGITLSETKAELEIGKKLQLTATVAPDNATDKEVVWSTSDASVATVSETGLVEAIAPGTAVITCTSHDGSNITAECTITVNPVLLTSITLNETKAELEIGDKLQLTATVAPDNATDKEVVWSTSDASIATVSETGLVEAIASGTAVITCTSHDGGNITAQCAITVKLYNAIDAAEVMSKAVGYYTLDGRRIAHLQHGVNIVRLSDGRVMKVIRQ